ncbi:MAG TPA: RHS repeat-associated core domain-containing protein [Bacteroidales bacterium]|nr:RHS repeat-associated core domain-containing protein [Bacteroidales bacterium]
MNIRKTVTTMKTTSGSITDYCGNFIYADNQLITIFAGDVRIAPVNFGNSTYWKYEYSMKDHLGNTRVVFAAHSYGQPELLQQTSYYPFGMTMQQQNFYSQNATENKYLYNSKELQDDQLAGNTLDWYDYGARFYDAALGRWHVVDPHAENYYPISPYAYVANNPIIRIDPDGRDIWELNNRGHVVNRIENTEIDQFVIIDNDGNRIEGNTYEYGTVTERKGHKDSRDRNIAFFEVAGDDNATAIFEFFGDNYTTTSNMPVEWTHAKVGKDDSERNIVGTIHEPDRTSVGHYLRTTGYTLREVNHNHPGGSDPSGIPRQPDGRPATDDIRGAELYQNKFPNVKLNVYRSRIAYPDKGGYHPYNRNGFIPSVFTGWRTNGN